MNLRQELHRADKQLAELPVDDAENFNATFSMIQRAGELAVKYNEPAAARAAKRVTGPLPPNQGRHVIADMVSSLSCPESDWLTVMEAAKVANLDVHTLWEDMKYLLTARGGAIMIRRADAVGLEPELE